MDGESYQWADVYFGNVHSSAGLSGGEPHGPTDQIGVIVTIFNLFVVAAALRPWHRAE